MKNKQSLKCAKLLESLTNKNAKRDVSPPPTPRIIKKFWISDKKWVFPNGSNANVFEIESIWTAADPLPEKSKIHTSIEKAK